MKLGYTGFNAGPLAQPQSIAAHPVLGDVMLESWGWRIQADAAQ